METSIRDLGATSPWLIQRAVTLDRASAKLILDAAAEAEAKREGTAAAALSKSATTTAIANDLRDPGVVRLAVMMADAEITTVEGLAGAGGTLHPVQPAFVDHDALQCGYCTPGQVCSAVAMMDEATAPPSGTGRPNLARCLPGQGT